MQIENNIRIVLVNTSQPGNIGGAMRALKNMSFSRLYLVQPICFPSYRAIWRAAGAAALLKQAVVCETLSEAVSGCQLVIGTSARNRRLDWPLETPESAVSKAIIEAKKNHQVAFVFGREDSGLTNHELQQCHFHLHIPANPFYSSLNLSAAVQLITYILHQQLLDIQPERNNESIKRNKTNEKLSELPANNQQMEQFYQHLEQVMVDLDFYDANHPKQTMARVRRLFQRARPYVTEVQILRGLLAAIEKKVLPNDNFNHFK